MAQQNDNPQSAFARNITNAQKVVVGNDQPENQWKDTVFAGSDLAAAVHSLKQTPGKNIITFGGAGFASSLIAAGLVDEFHLIVNPTVLGKGLSIFSNQPAAMNLELKSAISYPGGVVVLQYQKTVDQ
jgi:dihydrofolate reductase